MLPRHPILWGLAPTAIATGGADTSPILNAVERQLPNAAMVGHCWADDSSCVEVNGVIMRCYGAIGPLVDPNDRTKSEAFQRCVCNDFLTLYKNSWINCRDCYLDASASQVWTNWIAVDFPEFCASPDPNAFLEIWSYLNFTLGLAPGALSSTGLTANPLYTKGWTPPLTGAVTQITSLITLFSYDPDPNKPPTATTPMFSGTRTHTPTVCLIMSGGDASQCSTPGPNVVTFDPEATTTVLQSLGEHSVGIVGPAKPASSGASGAARAFGPSLAWIMSFVLSFAILVPVL